MANALDDKSLVKIDWELVESNGKSVCKSKFTTADLAFKMNELIDAINDALDHELISSINIIRSDNDYFNVYSAQHTEPLPRIEITPINISDDNKKDFLLSVKDSVVLDENIRDFTVMDYILGNIFRETAFSETWDDYLHEIPGVLEALESLLPKNKECSLYKKIQAVLNGDIMEDLEDYYEELIEFDDDKSDYECLTLEGSKEDIIVEDYDILSNHIDDNLIDKDSSESVDNVSWKLNL